MDDCDTHIEKHGEARKILEMAHKIIFSVSGVVFMSVVIMALCDQKKKEEKRTIISLCG